MSKPGKFLSCVFREAPTGLISALGQASPCLTQLWQQQKQAVIRCHLQSRHLGESCRGRSRADDSLKHCAHSRQCLTRTTSINKQMNEQTNK